MSIYTFEIDNEKEKKHHEKMTNMFFLMHFWMELIEDGKIISEFFTKRNYKNIAIYGMGYLGNHLKKQLENEGISVLYTIDKNKIDYNNDCLDMVLDISRMPKPDVVVVTPVMEYKDIKIKLSSLITSEIVSIEEVILSI